MAEFCDYLEEISTKCTSCWENGSGACYVKLGTQKYYAKFLATMENFRAAHPMVKGLSPFKER